MAVGARLPSVSGAGSSQSASTRAAVHARGNCVLGSGTVHWPSHPSPGPLPCPSPPPHRASHAPLWLTPLAPSCQAVAEIPLRFCSFHVCFSY
eukprot:COSAG01_NODE_2074_length_8491_cov_4.600024_10_plen_93_part_00